MKKGIAKIVCLFLVAGMLGGAFGAPADECRQAADKFHRAILSADLHGVYRLLPDSHQRTVSTLVSTGASKIDEGTWKGLQNFLYRAGGVMVKQYSYASERLLEGGILPATLKRDDAKTMTALWGGRIAAFAKAANQKKLSEGGLEPMLDIPGLMMSSVKEKLTPLSPPEVTARALGNGLVAICYADAPGAEFLFEKVDGKWIPRDLNRWFTQEAPVVIGHLRGWHLTPAMQFGLQQSMALLVRQAGVALEAKSRAEFHDAVDVGIVPFRLILKQLL